MPSTASLGEDPAALVSAVVGAAGCRHGAVAPRCRPRRDGVPLTFADGTTLKGSRLETADTAALVATLAPDLGAGTVVARIVAHAGSALLSEWVEERHLATWRVPTRCCALRRGPGSVVHALIPAGDPREEAHWRRTSVVDLDALEERLAALASPSTPGTCTSVGQEACAVGVCLVDYCPENIVLRRQGEPCLIDIETVSIAPCDYDLARTWYRWPMTGEQCDAYLAGYRDHRDASAFLVHAPFWHIAALANGALFRHRRLSGAPAVLAALRPAARRRGGAQ
jgi:hypothetical protein